MREMKITYLFPSKSRVDKFFNVLENIKTLSATDNYDVVAVLDNDDTEMNNDEVRERLSQYPNVKPYYGISIGKVNAINREINKIPIDTTIVALQSDDFEVIKYGFDNDIREAFSDDFKGLVHFPDGRVNERLVTYPLMHKEYLDRFGYIYNPEYKSVFCDNEQMEVAKKLNLYKYVDKKIMIHKHYRGGFGKPDALMEYNDSEEMYKIDGETYRRRKAANFYLDLSKQ